MVTNMSFICLKNALWYIVSVSISKEFNNFWEWFHIILLFDCVNKLNIYLINECSDICKCLIFAMVYKTKPVRVKIIVQLMALAISCLLYCLWNTSQCMQIFVSDILNYNCNIFIYTMGTVVIVEFKLIFVKYYSNRDLQDNYTTPTRGIFQCRWTESQEWWWLTCITWLFSWRSQGSLLKIYDLAVFLLILMLYVHSVH